jgi:hypothetical protein
VYYRFLKGVVGVVEKIMRNEPEGWKRALFYAKVPMWVKEVE